MSGALAGRTAIVTGAASGIGLGITKRLIADDAAVFAAARSKDDIERLCEHTEETLRGTVDNNLWTTIYCVRAVLPHMVSRGHGRIVNIGADSVRTGLVDHAMYNAAKGGVHAMVTAVAREFAGAGITANTVAPCYVRTPELANLFESGDAPARLMRVVEEATAIVPMGRPAIQLKSPQPSPSLPARTAASSPGKRFTSMVAAAWADGPFPTAASHF